MGNILHHSVHLVLELALISKSVVNLSTFIYQVPCLYHAFGTLPAVQSVSNKLHTWDKLAHQLNRTRRCGHPNLPVLVSTHGVHD